MNQSAPDLTASASHYPEDVTRPAFDQPHPTTSNAGYGGYYSQPSYATTVQRSAPPSSTARVPRRKRITPLGWLGRGLILVAISVVSGLVWTAIKPHAPQQTASQAPQTKYSFTLVERQESTHDCKSVSTYQVATYLGEHECDHLTRALFTTTLPGGQKVLTSVITIRMPDAATAKKLRSIAAASQTGDVKALVHTAPAGDQAFPVLQDDAYETLQKGDVVVIGDSAYFGRTTPDRDPQLLAVSTDALKLGLPVAKK